MPEQDKEFVNVFSKKFTGGPLGLGDPEDRTLRHVEEHIFVTQLVKDRAHHEKCFDFIKSTFCFEVKLEDLIFKVYFKNGVHVWRIIIMELKVSYHL